jgi:hypothetical protein
MKFDSNHSRVFAFALSLCALGFAGCAVETASEDPSQTETQAQAEEKGAAETQAAPEENGKPDEQAEPEGAASAQKPALVCRDGRPCMRPDGPTGPTPWNPSAAH